MDLKRKGLIVILLLVAFVIASAGETVILEGESLGGEDLVKGFDRGVMYMKPGTNVAQGKVNIPAAGKYEIYARIYCGWADRKGNYLTIKVADKEFIAGSTTEHPFRWDAGNYQVWHWVRAGEIELSPGGYDLAVKGSEKLDRIVLYKGDLAWTEPWLAQDESQAAGLSWETPDKGDIVFLPHEWSTLGKACIRKISESAPPGGKEDPTAIHACLLQEQSDSALRRFRLPSDGKFEVWARLFFYNKNMFEGRTMEEMQHCTYLLLDGCLQGTVMEQNRRRWTWYCMGTVDLKKGEHLLAMAHRGAPVLVGEVVLKRSAEEVEKCNWYVRRLPAVLPFSIPGGADPLFAKRAGQWLLLGPLAEQTSGKWLGEMVEDKSQVAEISLPKQAGRLVLEPNWPIECSAVIQPQLVGFHCKGEIEGLSFKTILLDRAGYSRLFPCKVEKDKAGWNYVYCFLAPSQVISANLAALGDSERPPDPDEPGNPLSRARFSVPSEKQPLPSEWGIMELTHILIESPGSRSGQILVSEPAFANPVTARAAGKAEEKQLRLSFNLRNRASCPLDVELHVYAGPIGENISEDELCRRWRRFVVTVPGNGAKDAVIALPVPLGDAYLVSYRVGMGNVKRVRLASGKEAQPAFDRELARAMDANCAYENPAWKRGFGPEEVSRRYGKDLRIKAGELDVTSLEYADLHNSIKPFRVIGLDLSDEAGWPEIHVAPGEIAFDPRLGRIKFCEGYNGPCEVVGNFRTGFGVPGGGAPVFFGDYALTPGGEGNYSVFDISRDDRPVPAAMVPSWYFEHDAFKLDNFLFFNSSHRGFTMIDDLSNPTRPGVLRRVELDVERWGRVRVVDEKLRLLLCSGGANGGITVSSLENPLRPKLRARTDTCWDPVSTGQAGKYIVITSDGLALLDVNEPEKPNKIIEWQFPEGPTSDTSKEGKEDWKKMSILAVNDERIACRLPNTEVQVAGRTEKRAVVACLEYQDAGARRGFRSLGMPCKDLQASVWITAGFYKECLYLLNGWDQGTQSSVGPQTPHSEWHTYRIADGSLQKVGGPLVDEFPTAYCHLRIHGNRGYVTEYNLGMWVFDLSDPANPKKIARYYGAAEGDALYVQDGMACFWQTFGGQIYLIDCMQPWAPVCRSVYWDGVWTAYQNIFRGLNTIWGKKDVLYSPRNVKGLAIIDLSNPVSPRQIGLLTPPEPGAIYGACNFRIRENALAITQMEMVPEEGKKESKRVVRFYDVQDPRKPQVLGEVVTRAGSALYWRGSYLYLAEGNWLTVVDTTDPRASKVLSETDLKASLPEFAEAFVCGIAVGKDVAYLTARGEGKQTALMVLVDVTDPKQPRPVRIFDSVTDYLPTECSESWANFYQDLVIRDDMLFVGSYGRIECFDISEPLLPRLVAQKDLGFQWSVGMLEGDYLYVPGLAEFILLKVPASPQRPRGQLKVE